MDYNVKVLLDDIRNVLGSADVTKLNGSTIDCFVDFNSLPTSDQIKMLTNFLHSLEFYKQINEKVSNQKVCEKEGHMYGDWYERVSFKCYKGSSFKNRIWCKKCARCGNIEMTFVKPMELIESEEEQQLENEIEILQRKLIKIRKEK